MPIQEPTRIAALLNIVEKVTTVAPGANHLLAEAMSEIRKLDETIRKDKLAEQNKPVTQDPVVEATGGEPSEPVEAEVSPESKPAPESDSVPDAELNPLRRS